MFELNLSEMKSLEKASKVKSIEDRVLLLEENSRYLTAALNSMNHSLASIVSSVALLAEQLNGKGGEG